MTRLELPKTRASYELCLVGVCGRTGPIQRAIVEAAPVTTCGASFAHLASITSLKVSGQDGLTLSRGDFEGLSNLETLYLRKSKLASLSDSMFAGLDKLATLDLDNNSLTTLPEDVFAGLPNLQELHLNRNGLKSLPEDVFDGLDRLRTLNLKKNGLTTLPEGLFAGLDSLRSLSLNANALTALPEDVFDGLSGLDTLNLKKNALTALPEDVFDDLFGLRVLRLHFNRLTTLPENVFDGLSWGHGNLVPLLGGDGLSDLQELNLSNNALTTLPEDVFDGLSGEMTVSRNSEGEVCEESGLPPSELELAELSPELLQIACLESQETVSNLKSLYLHNNSLTALPADVFVDLTNLQELNLSGNDLTCRPAIPGSVTALTLPKGGSLASCGSEGAKPLLGSVPAEFALGDNAPNPFNPVTTIWYALPEAAQVELTVYNLTGQAVRTLVAAPQSAGRYGVSWDGTDNRGRGVSSGIYYYRLQAGESFQAARKMLLLK